jgi:hypothetical protein
MALQGARRYGRPVAALSVPDGPFAAFTSRDLAYAQDDGMPFPGWAPPLLNDEEAKAGYEAGERVAVIAGDPADPHAGLVLDKRNSRLTLHTAGSMQLSYAGADLALAEALWTAGDHQYWARRTSAVQLRVSRRPVGAVVWTEEHLAHAPDGEAETVDWPEFGGWSALADARTAPWVGEGTLELLDADGWMLDAWEAVELLAQWRDLGRRYDAPRAFGLPAETAAKLAEPLGWQAAGRKWRKSDEVKLPGGGNAVVVTDAIFSAGAGASGEIVTTVTSGAVEVALDLPSATARAEMRRGQRPGSYPRPSTGAQVAVTAILEAGGAAHDAVVVAIRNGQLPEAWATVFG